jgi:PKD repeat protein
MSTPTTITITGSGFTANTAGNIWFDTNGNSIMDTGEPQVSLTTTSAGAIPSGITLSLPALPPDQNYPIRADIPSGGSIEALASFSTSSTTTSLTVTKYDAHRNVLSTQTVSAQYMQNMQNHLPVYGNGTDHYCFEGPNMSASTHDQLWDPSETGNNISSRDYGAAQGTDAADLCDLVGGASPGDTITFKGSDGWNKTFDYESVYNERLAHPLPELGRMVVTWYTQNAQETNSGYVPAYTTGMRLIFFPDTENQSLGEYVYGDWDMHQTLPRSRWYYYNNQYPSSSGLSGKYIYNIEIHQPNLIACDAAGNAKDSFAPGETVYVKGLGLAASTSYKLWIQPYPVTLTVLDSNDIPTTGAYTLSSANDPSGSQEAVTTNSSGDFSPVAIWSIGSSAASPAKYDIVADSQSSGTVGTFDTSDYIDNPGYEGFDVTALPPTAAFTADVTSGVAPLTVHFTDQSTGSPTSWAWDFNNDGTVDSTSQNPTYTYTTPGSYTVKLTVSNTGGNDSLTKTDYIGVSSVSTFTIVASAGPNGTISPSGNVTVNQGSDQTFNISASSGYHIVAVLVDSSSVGAVNSYTFHNVQGGHTVAVSFAINSQPPAWDLNGDHVCDIGDVTMVGLHWGETGTPGWIPEDLNNDGVINIGDVVVLGLHWGETW